MIGQKNRTRHASRLGLQTSILVAFFLAGGCATVEKPQVAELLWPAPPLTPRIKFVGVLRNQDDLGGKGAGELFAEALLGPKTLNSLQRPMGVAPSRDGKRLYVTDPGIPGVVAFDLAGRGVSLLGGESETFKAPFGVAVDDMDNVYVVDTVTKLIKIFGPAGNFLHNITHDSLERPTGIAIDATRRRIYVADSSRVSSENHVIRIFDMQGSYLRALGGRGDAEGKLYFPTYLALDGGGDLYVTDTMNARVQVFDPEGRHVRTFGRRGDALGMFDKPKGVALDSFGNVYVVDSSWSSVQIFNQRSELLLFFGTRGRMPGLLFNPNGIAIDKDNRIYVADAFNARVGIYQLINTKAEDSLVSLPPGAEKGGEQSERAEPKNPQP